MFLRYVLLSGLFYGLAVLAPHNGRLQAQCGTTVDAGPDLYRCTPPSAGPLSGSISGSYLNFTWSPTTAMTGANTLTPTVNPSTTTNYVLTATAVDLSNNLIDNGDFSAGNSGFSSDYVYSPGDLWPEGVYDVLTNPQTAHANFAPCPDHTGGGNMLAVNGSATAGLNVWCQTISVTPNTQYVFSAWVTSLVTSSPARLQFSINGGTIGPIFQAPGATCTWMNFYATWNSGAASSAQICIVNQNTIAGGNDFALDDILFSPVCVETDTVTVHIVNVAAVANPNTAQIPCNGAEVQLNGTGSSTGPNVTYNWTTNNGNIVSGENTLQPIVDAPGTYTLTVSAANGNIVCTRTASVVVTQSINPLQALISPPGQLGCGSSTMTLTANANQGNIVTYEWSASNGGNIIAGINTKTPTINAAGQYTVTVTNPSTGCTATASVNVTAATSLPVANITAPNTNLTCTTTTLPLSSAGSSAGAGITYAWTLPGGTTVGGASTNVTAAGNYILAVTNAATNCTTYDTVAITANTLPPTVSIAAPGILDCDTDSLSLAASTTPSAVNFSWNTATGTIASGGATASPIVTAAGAYQVTVTNPSNGCTATTSVTVSSNTTPPTAVVAPADTLTCVQTTITLSGNGSSTGNNITYQWQASNGGNLTGGINGLTPTANAAGTYLLTVTNTQTACTATASVNATANNDVVTAVANVSDTLTCTLIQTTLDANGSSTGAGLSYTWTTANGMIGSGANTPTPTVIAPGAYALLVNDPASGCSSTDTVIVLQNIAPAVVSIDPAAALTCTQPTQVLQAQVTGGPISLQWSTTGGNITAGDTTLSPTVNAPGAYTLTVTNLTNGCTSTASVNVALAAGTPLAIIEPPTPLTCATTNITLQAGQSSTGPEYTYAWSAASGGQIANGGASLTPEISATGLYTLTVTNTQNGCTATATVTATADLAPPLLDASPGVELTCALPSIGLTVVATGVGPFTYAWQTLGGHIVGTSNSASAIVDSAGTYTVLVTDEANGCTAAADIPVTANQLIPNVAVAFPPTLTCAVTSGLLNASITTAASGPISYHWYTGNGNILGGDTTATPLINAPGLYGVTVTDLANGCSDTGGALVSQNINVPNLTAGPPVVLTCSNPQLGLSAQNAGPGSNFSYAWTGGTIVSGDSTLTPLVAAPGLYTLVATNLFNGCTASVTASATANFQPPLANAGADDTLNCVTTALTLQGTASAAGTLDVSWTIQGNGQIGSGGSTTTPTITAPGQYILVATDLDNGCTATDAVEVFTSADAPLATIAPASELTCAVTQSILNATATTGAGLSYNWTGPNISAGGTTLTPTVDAPGLYSLTVTNANNGCTVTASVTVPQNITPPTLGIAPGGTLDCGVLTQVLDVDATAAPGNPLAYTWSTGNGNILSGGTTANPVVNQTGDYSVTVENLANGCTATVSTTVTIDTVAPVIDLAIPAALNCFFTQTTLSPTVTQVAPGFSFTWTTMGGNFVSGSNTLSPVINAAGQYSLEVTSTVNHCTAQASVQVSLDTLAPTVQISAASPFTCSTNAINLSANTSASDNGDSYVWSGPGVASGSATLSPTVTLPGIYTLLVSEYTNSCTATATIAVAIDTIPPLAAIATPLPLTCVQTSVTLQAGASSGGPGFSALWSTGNGIITGGANTLQPVVSSPGLYTLTVTDLQNGCTATATALTVSNVTPPLAEAGPPQVLHCLQTSATLQGSSGSAATYAWSTSNGHFTGSTNVSQPTIDAAGTYRLVVTNPVNGCTAVDSTVVSAVPPPGFDPEVEQPDCLQPAGTIAFDDVSGGAGPLVYSIDGGNTFSTTPQFVGLAPGNYELVIEDVYGCTDNAAVELLAPVEPELHLSQILTVDLGDSVLLEPVLDFLPASITTWQWTPGGSLRCPSCEKTYALPLETTLYTLHITDVNGCTAQATARVLVHRARKIYAPNVIMPNSNGQNQLFNLYGKGVAAMHSLRIYDRWGEALYDDPAPEINSETRGWDGVFRGKPVNPGVYVWMAEVEFLDGEKVLLSGDVTVVR